MAKVFDLDERTFLFAKSVLGFVNTLPRTVINTEIVKQLIRSSTSIGANYIEASEFLGKKDFGLRIKISRKEAKETIYWLKLLETNGEDNQKRDALVNEATELMKIFGAIIVKASNIQQD
jgi:four helix bundle protein